MRTSNHILLLPILSAVSLSMAEAATFLVDLGTNSPSTYPAGGIWNAYDASTVKNTGNFLTDSAGNNTAVSFIGAGTIAQGGSPGAGTFNAASVPSGLAWLATSSSEAAAADWLYTTTASGQSSHTYTFANLTAGNTFSLDLFSSRNNASSIGNFSYSLDGGSTWTGFTVVDSNGTPVATDGWDSNTTLTQGFNSNTQGYALYRYMNVSDITLTGTTLVVRARDVDNSTSYAGANAMRLTVIPEPSAASLSLIAIGLPALRRRR